MNPKLLLAAWVLTLLSAAMVSAAPVMDAARTYSQAGIAPIYMKLGDIKGAINSLHDAQELIADAKEPSEALSEIGRNLAKLSDILSEAGEANPADRVIIKQQKVQKVQDDDELIDAEGFAGTASKMLNSRNPEFVRFAAAGWGLTEKRAAGKFSSLAKEPSWKGTQDQIIAILIGMMQANRTESVDKNEELSLKINEALKSSHDKWIVIESSTTIPTR